MHALHILFVSVYPILFLVSHNATEAGLSDAIFPLIVSPAIAYAIYLKFAFVVRDPYARSLVVSLLFSLFFSFGHAAAALEPALVASAETLVAAAWTALFAFITLRIARAGRGLDIACGFLNFISGIAVALAAAGILLSGGGSAPAAKAKAGERISPYEVELEKLAAAPKAADGETSPKRPSVYYIILDGYPRNDVMNDIYRCDNSAFMKFLRKSGFFIAEKSLANHAVLTRHSLVSALNMQYLQKVFENVPPASRDLSKFIEREKDNEVVRFVKSKGYRYAAFYTFGTYRNPELEDAYLVPPGYYDYQSPSSEEFGRLLLNTTPVPFMASLLGADSELSYPGQTEYLRRSTLFIFDTLPKIAKRAKGPLFVYAHIGQPHPPFIFDADGGTPGAGKIGDVVINDAEAIVTSVEKRAEYREKYSRQAEFIAKKTMETIERILADSPEPPVIILQSDHGPASEFRMSTLESSNLKERFAILTAFYFPGRDYSGISRSVSPVNTFRIVFNRFLGRSMEILPDECYFSPIGSPYKFTRIDGMIKN